MRRRKFITLLGGAAAAWPLVAGAQQPNVPVIGFLHAGSSETYQPYVNAFLQSLNQAGHVDGKNGVILRWAEGRQDRLRAIGEDLRAERFDLADAPLIRCADSARCRAVPAGSDQPSHCDGWLVDATLKRRSLDSRAHARVARAEDSTSWSDALASTNAILSAAWPCAIITAVLRLSAGVDDAPTFRFCFLRTCCCFAA